MEVVIDKRRIVLQSGSTYTISLPKGWCEANGWKDGDLILVKTDGSRLILEKEG